MPGHSSSSSDVPPRKKIVIPLRDKEVIPTGSLDVKTASNLVEYLGILFKSWSGYVD